MKKKNTKITQITAYLHKSTIWDDKKQNIEIKQQQMGA